MSDVGVHTMLDKDTCKMVRGALVLMRGMWIGKLYKMLGRIDASGCHHTVIPETDEIIMCSQLDHVMAPTVRTHCQKGTSFYAQQRYG